jgi:hypothetical protein
MSLRFGPLNEQHLSKTPISLVFFLNVFLVLFIYFLQASFYVRPLLVFFQAPPYLKNKNEATEQKNLQNIWNEKRKYVSSSTQIAFACC